MPYSTCNMTDDEKQTSSVRVGDLEHITNRSESFVIFLVLQTKSISLKNSPASDCLKTSICFKYSQNINLQLRYMLCRPSMVIGVLCKMFCQIIIS